MAQAGDWQRDVLRELGRQDAASGGDAASAPPEAPARRAEPTLRLVRSVPAEASEPTDGPEGSGVPEPTGRSERAEPPRPAPEAADDRGARSTPVHGLPAGQPPGPEGVAQPPARVVADPSARAMPGVRQPGQHTPGAQPPLRQAPGTPPAVPAVPPGHVAQPPVQPGTHAPVGPAVVAPPVVGPAVVGPPVVEPPVPYAPAVDPRTGRPLAAAQSSGAAGDARQPYVPGDADRPGEPGGHPAPGPGASPGAAASPGSEVSPGAAAPTRSGASPAAPAPRGPRTPQTPLRAPDSVPTIDPRLAHALGRPQHGESVARRTGRSIRRLASSAAQDVAEETRIARELQQPVTTGRVIAVTSIRGGVGKSTTAALLGRTFNHYRHDPVLTMEADAALGTLPVRMGADSVRWAAADLARILNPAMQLTDVTGYLVPVSDGGWLLPGSQGRVGAPLDIRTYRTVTLALRRYFAVTVVDCETLPGEVARTAMDTAHARVVVAPMTAEGVNGTRQVLDWLGQLPHSALASTVVALTANSPDLTLDLKTAVAHLKEAGVHVVPVPYDRHLAQGGPIRTALLGQETRAAAITLAAEAMTRAVRMR